MPSTLLSCFSCTYSDTHHSLTPPLPIPMRRPPSSSLSRHVWHYNFPLFSPVPPQKALRARVRALRRSPPGRLLLNPPPLLFPLQLAVSAPCAEVPASASTQPHARFTERRHPLNTPPASPSPFLLSPLALSKAPCFHRCLSAVSPSPLSPLHFARPPARSLTRLFIQL